MRHVDVAFGATNALKLSTCSLSYTAQSIIMRVYMTHPGTTRSLYLTKRLVTDKKNNYENHKDNIL